MARGRIGDWNVNFTLVVEDDGYEWRERHCDDTVRVLGHNEPIHLERVEWLLEPVWWHPNDWNRPGPQTQRGGADMARAVFNAFRRLSRDLDTIDRRRQAEAGRDSWSPIDALVEHDPERQERIKDFANQYGVLGTGLHTFGDWIREAGEFLDALHVETLIRHGRTREIEHSLIYHADMGTVYYRGDWVSLPDVQGPRMITRARTPGLHQVRKARSVKRKFAFPAPYPEFEKLSSTSKAWKVLNLMIAPKLDNGLSLMPGGAWGEQAGIVNAELRSLLYLRLWLDAAKDRPRVRICEECEEEFGEGRKGTRYCSDRCRQKAYRHRRQRTA
jgi:hypothetical protein